LARRRSVPAGNGGERRRLRAPRADSVGEEVEGGEAELLASSEEVGVARNGGKRRRPSSGLAVTGRKTGREESQGEKGKG
jgi:hypothetical protein